MFPEAIVASGRFHQAGTIACGQTRVSPKDSPKLGETRGLLRKLSEYTFVKVSNTITRNVG